MEESKQENQESQNTGFIGDLIKEGFYDKLIIIGFPYDEGAKTIGARGGSDYGPDSFRRFVKKIGVIKNPEYETDISKGLPQISDYGNIQINQEPGQAKATIKELLDKLTVKVAASIKRGNIPFVIGGSRDLFGAVSDALQLQKSENMSAYISINHTLDVDQYEITHKQPNQQVPENPFKERQLIPKQTTNKRYLLEKMDARNNVLFEFGTSGLQVDSTKLDYFNERNPEGKIIWMSDIRKSVIQNTISNEQTCTLGGYKFLELLNKVSQDVNFDQIYVSFNLECVEAAVGVTTNKTAGGFTSEEAIEICYLAGLHSDKIVAFDICEYNPFVEDWRTGRLVATMFYYFALGLSQRLQKIKNENIADNVNTN